MEHIKKLIINFKYKDLLYKINESLRLYIVANVKIVIIQFVEYTLIFKIIGHPNYLLLGILNSFNNFIPYVGVLITNIVAIITASIINRRLLFFTALVSIVFPNIDSYLITPRIYTNSNKISRTLIVLSIIVGGYFLGIYGVLFAIPVLIIIVEILNYKNVVL